jgi:hypothetical protein
MSYAQKVEATGNNKNKNNNNNNNNTSIPPYAFMS